MTASRPTERQPITWDGVTAFYTEAEREFARLLYLTSEHEARVFHDLKASLDAQMTLDEVLPKKAHARRTDPETSHEAAESVRKIRESQSYVLACIRDSGPVCDEDMREHYERHGFPQQSPSGLRTRRRELADMGKLVDTGRRVLLPSGRRSIVWGLADERRDDGLVAEV